MDQVLASEIPSGRNHKSRSRTYTFLGEPRKRHRRGKHTAMFRQYPNQRGKRSRDSRLDSPN